jgi:Beta-ketoacyl synthase, N-terminal domain
VNSSLYGHAWSEPILVTGAAAAASPALPIPAAVAADVALAPWAGVDRFLAERAPAAAALVTALGRLVARHGEAALPGPAERGIVVGTWSAALNEVHEFIAEVDAVGANLVNPGLFPFTVINAAAGLAAIEHRCEGPNLTLNNGPTSALDAVAYGADLIASGQSEVVFAGGFESLSEQFSRAFGKPRGPLSVATVLALARPRPGMAQGRAARLLAFCSAKEDARGPEALTDEVLAAATALAREAAGGERGDAAEGCEVLPAGGVAEPEAILLALLEAVERARAAEGERLVAVRAAAAGQPAAAVVVLGPFASPAG